MVYEKSGTGFTEAVDINKESCVLQITPESTVKSSSGELKATVNYSNRNSDSAVYGIGNIGKLKLECSVEEV